MDPAKEGGMALQNVMSMAGRTLTTETARDHVKVVFDTGTGRIEVEPLSDG